MRRRAEGERVQRLRIAKLKAELHDLRRRCTRWAQDNREQLAAVDPEMPESLDDRGADNWRPLVAIAEVAGGIWPTLIRTAAEELCGQQDDAESRGVMLLADIRAILEELEKDRITSELLASKLGDLEDRPWQEWGRGRKPITKAGVARLLKPFEIRPNTIRTPEGTPRGYRAEDFQDAFNRYLTDNPGQTATPQHPLVETGLGRDQTETEGERVAP